MVSAGHIYLDGTDVTAINEKQIARFRRETLGFVFQDFNLLDTLTISETVSYTHLDVYKRQPLEHLPKI